MPDDDEVIYIPAEVLALASPEERRKYKLYLISKALEKDRWDSLLPAVAPGYASAPFADHHKLFWDWVWKIDPEERPHPFVGVWPRGGAKLCDILEVLPTPSGWTTIGEIQIGDQVFDEYGKPCTVLDLSPIQHKPTYRVHFRGGSTTIVSGDHLWSVLDRRSRRVMFANRGEIIPDWASWIHHDRPMTICDVAECGHKVDRRGPSMERWCEAHWKRNDRYGDPLGGPAMRKRSGQPYDGSTTGRGTYSARTMTTEQIIEAGLMDGDEYQFAIPVSQSWDLPEADLPIEPYLLGIWLGDGTAADGAITQSIDDRDEMFGYLNREWHERPSSIRPGNKGRVHGLYGFRKELRLAGLLNNKHVPAIYLRASAGQRLALLQGMMDTDGTAHRNAASFTNTNHQIAMSVHELAISLGYRASITEECATLEGVDRGPCWRVRISGARSEAFRLSRKRNAMSADPMSINSSLHYITKIESLEEADVRCLVVDSPSHLFLLGRDAIPTHNSTSAEMAVAMLGARGKRSYALYCSETQDQADDHVANVASLLEGYEIGFAYPEMGERLVGKHGNAKGWRRNRIRTASGFTVDAIGLDSAARGIKLEEMRPDLLIFDDIDGESDSELVTAKKIKTITYKLIPAGSKNCAILAIQNLVHADSVFARLADNRADFMRDRTVSGPIPAIWDFEYADIDGKWMITEGHAAWPGGQSLKTCQAMMNDMGITAFLAECQHETLPETGGMYDHIDWKGLKVSEAEVPPMKRTVVWLDPAVTDTKQSDSQGIMIDGLGTDGLFYRLWAWEGRTSPLNAMKRAIEKAIDYHADTVGVETDQGGDTWKIVYKQACEELRDSGILTGSAPRYDEKKAGAGHGAKATRAQRMLVDYERGKFRHVAGTTAMLEAGLDRFPKTKPFDLVDAAYWSWLDLSKGTKTRAKSRTPANLSIGVFQPK